MKLNHIKKSTGFRQVSDIKIPDTFFRRMKCGVKELDELFGEGILPGSTYTFNGQPGSGKSSLQISLTESLALAGYEIGYASGEESIVQVAYTCKRLNAKTISVTNETDIDTLAAAMKDLDVLVVDSFQALTTTKNLKPAALSKYAISTLIGAAKEHDCALFFICHVTKSGGIKCSSELIHAVDVNYRISTDEEAGDSNEKLLEVYKNRYGPCKTFRLRMTSHGFEFTGAVEPIKANSKKNRKADLAAKILAMDPPNITKERIMKSFDLTGSQAYLILKELTDSGKLVKMSRGSDAVFKKTLKAEKVEA